MPFADLDTAAVARALSQLVDEPDDLADAFFERREEITLPMEEGIPGYQVVREEGLALRLIRGNRTWFASRDGVAPYLFTDALRQVARVLPPAPYPEPKLPVSPWEQSTEAQELAELPRALERRLRQLHVAFPMRLTVRRHRRAIQVVGTQLVPGLQQESFYSCRVELPWGSWGSLLPDLGEGEIIRCAQALACSFQYHKAKPPQAGLAPVTLGPAAAAVLLHEAVAHALEVDTLTLGGNPEAAIGLELADPRLSVLDDPKTAPEGVRRSSDDEGVPTCRRWLLNRGVVQQPLADLSWARGSEKILPGAARRGTRHQLPAPRSTHLEVLPGEESEEDLLSLSDGGLYIPEASGGQLNPLDGTFQLRFPFAQRIRGGVLEGAVGPGILTSRVGEMLASLRGVGDRPASCGAGWCAKQGVKVPVWATTPGLALAEVSISP
ncbi:MAG: TldD/PmbA family protein [Acidobacteriota bacterium]